MGKLLLLLDALNAGKSLANPAAWKRAHIAFPYLVTILTFAASFCVGCFTAPDIDTMALGFEVLGGALFNHFFVAGTTTKLGIK